MDLTLKVWRQDGPDATRAASRTYDATDINEDMSFLEMLDVLNERLIDEGGEPIAFDHDCREGICGTCGMMINGQAHGPEKGTATCQLHMRKFNDGDDDHHRAVAGRGVPDHQGPRGRPQRVRPHHRGRRLHHAPTPARRRTPTSSRPKEAADAAMDAAACIGCGACVAACPNSAAQLFTVGQGRAPQPAAPGPARALEPHR